MLRVSNEMPVSNYSVVVPAENGTTFSQSNVIRFKLTQNLRFIDPYTSYLTFDLTLTDNNVKGFLTGKSGANIIIRTLRVIADGHVIEEIDNYNALAELHANYGFDLGEKELKDVMEGGGMDRQQYANGLNNPTTSTVATSPDNKNIKVCLPLSLSGILGSRQALPLVAMGDLEIELTLDTDDRVLKTNQHQFNSQSLATFVLTDGVAVTQIDLETNAGGSGDGGTITQSVDWGFSATGTTVGQDNPWIIGQRVGLIVISDDSDVVNNTNVVITNVQSVGGKIRLTITGGDPVGTTGASPRTAAVRVKLTRGSDNAVPALSYQVNKPEYVCRVVVPPPEYLQQLQSQIVAEGYALDVHTWTTYREHTTGRTAGQASADTIEVPCYSSRAKAIFWRPNPEANMLDLDGNARTFTQGGAMDWNGKYNHGNTYQIQIGELRIPNRVVKLNPADFKYEYPSQEHITELIKALESSGIGVHNLRRHRTDYVIGRSLSAYGGTTDMRMKGARLYFNCAGVNPESANNQTVAAMNWYNWVAHIKRLVITPSGLQVLY